VRFRQAAWLHDFVRDTLRHKLTLGRPAAGFLQALTTHANASPALVVESSPYPSSPPAAWERPSDSDPPAVPDFALSAPTLPAVPGVLPFAAQESAPARNGHGPGCASALDQQEGQEVEEVDEVEESDAGPTLHGLASLRPLGQLRESFILAVNQEGLWIIDQHVAHERVLFERVLRERQVERVERQRLLMPLLIDLLPAQMVTFAAIARELEANGFEAEPFGPRTIAIKAAPVGLEGGALERMLIEVLEQAGSPEQAENLEAARTRIAASIACHAAIKINTPLDTQRMEWLLAELAATEHPTSCPHGRPIVLRYAWKDIQRAFHRI
jgi:DNA mismatch repair protein MutL